MHIGLGGSGRDLEEVEKGRLGVGAGINRARRGELTLEPLEPGLDQRGDRTRERAWGSVASRYGCPVIVLLHVQSIERLVPFNP